MYLSPSLSSTGARGSAQRGRFSRFAEAVLPTDSFVPTLERIFAAGMLGLGRVNSSSEEMRMISSSLSITNAAG